MRIKAFLWCLLILAAGSFMVRMMAFIKIIRMISLQDLKDFRPVLTTMHSLLKARLPHHKEFRLQDLK